MRSKNIGAWVKVDGKEVTEYSVNKVKMKGRTDDFEGVSEDEPSDEDEMSDKYRRDRKVKPETLVCWIECQAGKEFTVLIENLGRFYDINAFVYLDGFENTVGSLIVDAGYNEEELTGRPVAAGTMRPLRFVIINTAEEEGFGISAPGAGVGEIKVETWQGKVMDDPSDDDSNEDELAALPDAASTYTERKVLDQKLSHTTGFGNERPDPGLPIRATGFSSLRKNKPCKTFIFKYRSAAMLQLEGILPVPQPAASSSQRNATPGPSGVARQNTEPILLSSDEESEDDEVIKNAQAALKKMQADLAKSQAALDAAKAKRAARKGVNPDPGDVKPKIEDTNKDRVVSSPAPVIKPEGEEDVVMAPPANSAEAVDDGASDASLSAVEVKTEVVNEDGVPRKTAQQKGKKRTHED